MEDLISSDDFQKILDIFKKYYNTNGGGGSDSNLEIEFRIGYIEPNDDSSYKFNTNVGETIINKIESRLKGSKILKSLPENKQVVNYYHTKKGSPPVRSSDGLTFVNKEKLCTIDFKFEPFDVRLSFSTETVVKGPRVKKIVYTRNKDRTSFEYKIWNYDLTKVEYNENNVDFTKYEVELELKTNANVDAKYQDPEYILKSSLLKLRDLSLICENDCDPFFSIKNINQLTESSD